MGRMPRATYLWPGLPQLWSQGTWSALALAVGFAVLVNLALAATVVWSELLTPGVRNSAWMAVALVWGGSALVSHRRGRHHLAGPSPLSAEETYAEALDHYLKGNWFEAEHALAQVLRRNPRDLDAGLMLATLFRHTGRIDEAERQLQRLERLEGSQKWQFEIGRERELLHEAGASMTTVGGRSGDPPGA